MSLSPEAVNQAIFVSALFLTFISVPKLVALSVWYVYKVWLFLNLGKVMKSKPIQSVTREGTAEVLKKQAQDPKLMIKNTFETLGEFNKSIRDPLIEASFAGFIMFFLSPLLPGIETWIVMTLIIIVVVVFGAITLALLLWRRANRILRMMSIENHSLSPEPKT